MVRFLQTGDWQLGMSRHYFPEGVQEHFSQARFDAIGALGRVAEEEKCDFIVVCGDVFESNHVDRRTVAKALEALKEVKSHVILLPGNHDPLDASSIYRSKSFLQRKPDNVTVLDSIDPIAVIDGVEIVGIPWFAKQADHDLVAEVLGSLEPSEKNVLVAVGHGILDILGPDPDDPALICLDEVDRAIDEKRISFLALGDRHSAFEAGGSGRVWYSGSPEPTDFREDNPGHALVVEISKDSCEVKTRDISTWRFIEQSRIDLNSAEDLETLQEWLTSVESKDRTVVKLRLFGTLSLSLYTQLEEVLTNAGDLLAALELREDNLLVVPEDEDFSSLAVSGFVDNALEELRASAESQDSTGQKARDALALFLRLQREMS